MPSLMTVARESHDPPLTRPASAPPSLPGGSLLVSALAQFSMSADSGGWWDGFAALLCQKIREDPICRSSGRT
jgi:hypothetical protein